MSEVLMDAPQLQPQVQEIPCPVKGDVIVFTNQLDDYLNNHPLPCLGRVKISDTSQYAILQDESDVLHFVLYLDTPELCLTLAVAAPGFDSTALWYARDPDNHPYLICIHYPVSGRTPIPESCKKYIIMPEYRTMLGATIVDAYDLCHTKTLRDYRRNMANVDPQNLCQILQKLASTLDELYLNEHALMRISPDTIVVQDDIVKFIGISSLDLPWNERCAQAHPQEVMACIPPECLGYLRQKPTQTQSVYAMGAIAYYLIAEVQPPVCESMNYEVALMPRAFETSFPIGWDEIIMKALSPNPGNRFQNPDEFLASIKDALDIMELRKSGGFKCIYDAAIDTHIGIGKKLRCPINQDAVFMRQSNDGQRILLVVGDGVSTSIYGSGDIASGLLVDAASAAWYSSLETAENIDTVDAVSQILFNANHAICQYIRDRYADESPSSADCMGTTALIAIIENTRLTLGSIGDSRAYIIRQNSCSCITRDHNLFTVGIINGLPVETCALHPHAGSLVQCLGYYEEDEETEREALAFDIYSIQLLPGDNLILTTDGILDYIACDINESEVKIADIVRNSNNAGLACLELILQANMGGGGDNCGVGIIRVLPDKAEC